MTTDPKALAAAARVLCTTDETAACFYDAEAAERGTCSPANCRSAETASKVVEAYLAALAQPRPEQVEDEAVRELTDQEIKDAWRASMLSDPDQGGGEFLLAFRAVIAADRALARPAPAGDDPAEALPAGVDAETARKTIHEYVGQAASAATSGLSVDDLEGIADDLFYALFRAPTTKVVTCSICEDAPMRGACPKCGREPPLSPAPAQDPSPAPANAAPESEREGE